MMILSEPMRVFAEKLPMGWKVSPFGALLSESLRNGIYKGKEFHGSGTRIVNMGELFEHEYISSQDMRRIELTPQEKERSTLQDGDLLFARRSLVLEGAGKCSLVMSPGEEVTFESSIIRARPAQEMVVPRFLYYLFASPLGRAILASIATRTAVSGIRGSDLAQVALPLPPLRIQRRIAGILSAYDDLIENSQRRIKILEEMARRLYREWFVHFRFPGHEACSFVESSLGEIPEGWEAATLGVHLAALESGKRPKGGIREIRGGVPSIGAENINGIGRHNFIGEKFVPREFFRDMQKGVVLDRDVAIYKDGAYIGKSSYFRDGFPHLECCVNEHVFLLRATGERLKQNALYLWLQEPDTVQLIRSKNANAAQPGINQQIVSSLELVLPDSQTSAKFDQLVDPLLAEVVNLAKRIQNLRRTRDLLLPRLLSGQIDVEALPGPGLTES
jgi:type I restriction enzyme S subunit